MSSPTMQRHAATLREMTAWLLEAEPGNANVALFADRALELAQRMDGVVVHAPKKRGRGTLKVAK